MARIFSSTWAFLKSIKWHLLLIPAYFYVAMWIWNFILFLASTFAGSEKHLRWYGKFRIVGEMNARWHTDPFVFWFVGISIALVLIAYVIVRLLPGRFVALRRALAICGILIPVSASMQMLNMLFIYRYSGYFESKTLAATWICIPLWSIVFTWLAVREVGRKRGDVVKVVAEKKIPWPNLFSEKGETMEAVRLWGVEGIPANFLVGPDGSVRGRNFRGTDVAKKILSIVDAEESR